MNDIKVYIKADPSKELQDEIIEILEINQNCFKGTNEPNLHSAENIVDLFKPIYLTELIENKWNEYRIVTNNEDAWSFKEWLKTNI